MLITFVTALRSKRQSCTLLLLHFYTVTFCAGMIDGAIIISEKVIEFPLFPASHYIFVFDHV